MREQVISIEAVELVPGIVHTIDDRLVGAGQATAELEVVGWIGKDQID